MRASRSGPSGNGGTGVHTPSLRWWLVGAAMALLLGSNGLPGAAPAGAEAYPGSNGLLAFQSVRDGTPELYVIQTDGSGLTRLTENEFNEQQPEWSPDGTRIAFMSERDGSEELYVMRADGTDPTRLTNDTAGELWPSWSPDGTRLAFTSTLDGGDNEVYAMDADGTDITQLTDNSADEATVSWSAQGRIAFTSDRDGDNEVYVMDADGTDQTRLTESPGFDGAPNWSPDGTRIVFNSSRTGNGDVYVMDADGTDVVNLTPTSTVINDAWPTWSPDGTRIAFNSGGFDPGGIWLMDPDGTDATHVPGTIGASDGSVSWQPTENARPDGRIKRGATGTPVGDDVYNATADDQTRFGRVGPGGAVTYYVTVQNDASYPEKLQLRGGAGTTRFTIRYRDPSGTDITARMTGGTYRTPVLSAGATHRIKVTVTARAGTPAGASISRKVVAASRTWPTIDDRVAFVTTRV